MQLYRKHLFHYFLFGETKLGKNGEKISEKVQKTAVFGLKSGKNSTFLKKQFASDSVIRWFESSYPSQLYHILYKECASEYNIWFLFYMAIFTLSQIGERNGETFRTEFCFSPRFQSVLPAIAGFFVLFLLFQKIGLGKVLSVNDLLRFFELKFLRVMRVHRGSDRAAQRVPRPDADDLAQNTCLFASAYKGMP